MQRGNHLSGSRTEMQLFDTVAVHHDKKNSKPWFAVLLQIASKNCVIQWFQEVSSGIYELGDIQTIPTESIIACGIHFGPVWKFNESATLVGWKLLTNLSTIKALHNELQLEENTWYNSSLNTYKYQNKQINLSVIENFKLK